MVAAGAGPSLHPTAGGRRRRHPADRLGRPRRHRGSPAPRGSRVRPAGRVDQRHGRQPGPGPRPGAPVPPVGLPRAADAAHLDPRLRRRRARRGDRRPGGAAAVISAEARRLERLVQDLLDLARLDADRFSLRPPADRRRLRGPRRWSTASGPGPHELGLDLHTGARLRGPRAGCRPTPTAWARSWPTWSRTPPRSPADQVVVGTAAAVAPEGRRPVGGRRRARHPAPTSWPGCSSATSPPTGHRGRRQGSGLGLAIVAELATAMGAAVEAESPVGRDPGTRMVVSPPGDPAGSGAVRELRRCPAAAFRRAHRPRLSRHPPGRPAPTPRHGRPGWRIPRHHGPSAWSPCRLTSAGADQDRRSSRSPSLPDGSRVPHPHIRPSGRPCRTLHRPYSEGDALPVGAVEHAGAGWPGG